MTKISTFDTTRSALAAALALTVALGACQAPEKSAETSVEEPTLDRAAQIAQEMLIVDTHVDLPYRLIEKMEDVTVATEGGDFDLPRAKAGGLNAPFMSIYVPADLQETGGAKEHAEKLIGLVEDIVTQAPDEFAIANSPAEVEAAFDAGKLALPLGMENGAPIETLGDLDHFYGRGIRYITLTHSENNQICDSSYSQERTWNGLSPFGRDVVEEMNRLGIMVDISHVSDDAFWQVIELTRAPVIASHSSCRHFTPGFERNMADDMIEALAENGGVIQINFGSTFLTEASNQRSIQTFVQFLAWLEETGIDRESEEAANRFDEIQKANPVLLADVTDVVDHIDHVVQIAGIDHVGIGSDFDGVGPTTPTGLKDVSMFPNLIRELLARDYSEADIEKILSGNTMRVWREVERVAAESSS